MSKQPSLDYHGIEVADPLGQGTRVVEVRDPNADQFAARIRKNFKERKKWAARSDVHCYRVYDADLPDFAVAVDVYEQCGPNALQDEPVRYLHVAEYAAPASVDPFRARCRFEDVMAVAPVVCGIQPGHAFSKVRQRDRGGSQYSLGDRRSCIIDTMEGGLLFEVDLNGYLDTGLFLDHRDTRMMVGRMAAGKRFLNLFAYTGSCTVHAAAGGAASTLTVDLSQTYLDWAQRNMALNGFTGKQHAFYRADVTRWVEDVARMGAQFDLVFVDPPTFSNSKSMGDRTWDVQRDHVQLLDGVASLLATNGVAVFSCNLRSFKPDTEALAARGVRMEDISVQTIPRDFERNPKIHRCYLVTRA